MHIEVRNPCDLADGPIGLAKVISPFCEGFAVLLVFREMSTLAIGRKNPFFRLARIERSRDPERSFDRAWGSPKDTRKSTGNRFAGLFSNPSDHSFGTGGFFGQLEPTQRADALR